MAQQRGFTALEATVAVTVIGLAFLAAYIVLGRFFVEQYDAVSVATKAGMQNARVERRHDAVFRDPSCESNEAVGYTMVGETPDGGITRGMACCGTWLKGCTFRQQ